jgi:hypothetical protein
MLIKVHIQRNYSNLIFCNFLFALYTNPKPGSICIWIANKSKAEWCLRFFANQVLFYDG